MTAGPTLRAAARVFAGSAAAGLVLLLAPSPAAESQRPSHYDPYRFLIGEWNVRPEGQTTIGIARFRWGPGESSIWHSLSTLSGGVERPHFEGMLTWNGVRKNPDMLLSLDLSGGRVQEQGIAFVAADGTVVREITAIYSEGAQPIGQPKAGPAGATARFRQTFKPAGLDRILTSLTRETRDGWVATFPGSDRAVMSRRPS
jgi:hypothetical protein